MSPSGSYGEQVRSAYELARAEQIPAIAAGLAYYEFNSLIPFVVLVLVGLTATGRLQPALVEFQSATGGQWARPVLTQLGSAASGRLQAGVIALFILLWSSFRLLQTVDGVFVRMYGEHGTKSRVETARDLVLAFVTFVLAVMLFVVLGVAFASQVGGLVLSLLAPVALFLALSVAFFPMYYAFPAVETTVRESLPGTLLAAAGWTVSGVFFGLYARVSESVQLYGAAGGLLLLLTWLYVGGLLILTGVVLNASLSPHHELDPER